LQRASSGKAKAYQVREVVAVIEDKILPRLESGEE
jgi:hypothetical protein